MDWSTFWASFKSTIEDRKELSNTQRLHYLRQAVKDPDVQLLLHSPVETPDMYLDVVQELKARFNKTREIHRHLTKALLDLPSPKQTRVDLSRLADTVKRTMDSIKATKHYDLDSFLTSLVYLILPSRLQTLWDQHTKKDKGVLPITQLLTFIREHAETLPSTSSAAQQSPQPAENPGRKNPRRSDRKPEQHHQRSKGNIHVVTPSPSYKWECSLCRPEKHPLHLCPKWAAFNITQRLGHIQAKSLCSNCLAGGHTTNDCKSTYRCRECSQPHHTTIHQQSATVTPINSSTLKLSEMPDALMTTTQLLLIGPKGEELKARALIDSGAGLSLVSRRVAQILNLPLESATLHLSAVQGEPSKPVKHVTSLHISPLQNRQKKILCKPAVTQMVISDLPPEPIHPIGDLPHIMGLQLADPDYHCPGRIDILLGADMAPKIMVKELLRHGTDDEPIAQATHFGWVLSGPIKRKTHSQAPIPTNHQVQTSEPELDNLLTKFWEAEEPEEEEEPPLSVIEEQVEQHFSNTILYLPSESRYQVTLPRKPDMETLGDSRAQALSRYLSNERSITRKGIWKPFQEVVQNYLDLDHAEPVPASEPTPQPHFYLPMHAVFKDSSSSTKLRVVFDGSAVTTSGKSLNQALLVGPTIQPTLSNILLKFRCYPIALNADISKMYREVKLSPQDKDLHRFLWRASPNLPVQDYRMTRVTFGVSASPYLAVKTLQQTAEEHGEEYPNVTQHIKTSFYVDDFLGGANTTQEAVELFTHLREVLLKGGFSLCKWRSSSSDILQAIPADLQEKSHIKDATTTQAPTHSKALGLEWDSRQDTMSPSICVSQSYRPTKRGIISDVSKTYDILGWIAPTVLSMKLLYQQLWKTGHEWDQEVTSELMDLHGRWRSELPLLSQKRLPRCYSLPTHTILKQELHGFSDACKMAFGAVVYCRTTYHDHPPVISLVTAKTKFAKLKPPTVPNLELCGAVLLTKLLINTAAVLEIPKEHWHAWTDSAIVLAWLDGRPREMKTFVYNRVSFIMQATFPQTWQHVPTAENPADCASRGMMPKELLNHTLWWNGPVWLSQDPIPLPKQPRRRTLITSEEISIHVIHQHSSVATDVGNRSSNYHTTLSIAAWCLRFCQRIKDGRPTPDNRTKHLTGAEITAAEHWLLREAQARAYPKERKALQQKEQLPKSSRLRALAPLLDEEQLLRVGG